MNLHTDILDTPDIFWDEAAKPRFGLSENLGKRGDPPKKMMVKRHFPHYIMPILGVYKLYLIFRQTHLNKCCNHGWSMLAVDRGVQLLDFQERFEKIYVACRTYLDIVTWILTWI